MNIYRIYIYKSGVFKHFEGGGSSPQILEIFESGGEFPPKARSAFVDRKMAKKISWGSGGSMGTAPGFFLNFTPSGNAEIGFYAL